MNVLHAFALVGVGMVVEWLHNRIAWAKYYEGKREACEHYRKTKGA